MHENNPSLFSHTPAEPESYPASGIAHQPVFSSAVAENGTGADATPEDGAERP
ncbi:hypothetical protein [Nocardia sp. NPDC019395]|uniref:hypothetical protein n=1 Tax=Nocardia sp. NPDC019395 TaxID=3154686 RepID=UPI0033FF836B